MDVSLATICQQIDERSAAATEHRRNYIEIFQGFLAGNEMFVAIHNDSSSNRKSNADGMKTAMLLVIQPFKNGLTTYT